MKISNNLEIVERGDKKNQSIIFIHGFPYDNLMWDNQTNHLMRDYYCISYDIRGLGHSSSGNGQFTLEELVDDLFSIMDQKRIEKPVVCGLSMGGYILFRAVERDQSRFSGLIFCDTKPAADDNAAKLKRAAGIKKINQEGLEKYCESSIPDTFSDITLENNYEIYDAVFQRSIKMDPVGVKGCILAMLSRTDTTHILEQINIPTLIISGSLDKITPPKLMRDMHEKIKDSEFAVVPRAAHISPVENPGFVNNVIEGFLKRRIRMENGK